jgi:hypothetical protein
LLLIERQRRYSIAAWGSAPGIRIHQTIKALKARFNHANFFVGE